MPKSRTSQTKRTIPDDPLHGESESGYLGGKLLIAMPNIGDPRFERSVIFMCAHSATGAMGLILNKRFPGTDFAGMLKQLAINAPAALPDLVVLNGGPVEMGRGFVLHSGEYSADGTVPVEGGLGLTATLEILKAIAHGSGPKRAILALGYAGWSAGQLDAEIQRNGWLHGPADDDIVFDTHLETKWERAVHKVGINPAMLSTDAGHA